MYTTKNSFTRISKEIIINKIHNFDNLMSMENIPYTINVEFTAMPSENVTNQKDINITHSVNYHKINFLLESILHESFLTVTKSAEHLLGVFSEFDNNIILSPDNSEASLGVMLHAKLSTITKECFIGCIEIIDNRSKTCYNYMDDENDYTYLPTITDMIVEGGIAFHEQPWWFRDDISTYDGSAKSEEEFNNYIDNHFEPVQEAMSRPLSELETRLRDAMSSTDQTAGEIIDLEEFKSKKAWKPTLI